MPAVSAPAPVAKVRPSIPAVDATPAPAAPSAPEQLVQMLAGFWVARSLSVAARIGVADHVSDDARPVEELALATGTHAPSLYRLLRALAGVGVFREEAGRRFGHSPVSELLRTGRPDSMRAIADSIFGGCHYRAWGDLEHSVRTGEIAFDHAFGTGVWDHYALHEDEQSVFDDAMSEFTALFNPAIVKAYDFSRLHTLVDVGGGHGALLASILKENPGVRGILFDQPHVAEGAGRRFAKEGLATRCQAFGGNFFQLVPAGADAYLMKFILHDWNDEQAATILRNVHKAALPGARLLVVEMVVPPDNAEPSLARLGDVNMLVMTGGRERTEEEFAQLFELAGFDLVKVHKTEGPMCVIEGIRR